MAQSTYLIAMYAGGQGRLHRHCLNGKALLAFGSDNRMPLRFFNSVFVLPVLKYSLFHPEFPFLFPHRYRGCLIHR